MKKFNLNISIPRKRVFSRSEDEPYQTVVDKDRIDEDQFEEIYKNERLYQPSKQKRRLRWTRGKVPQMEWYSDLHHFNWDELTKPIDGFIAKNVGKPFDEVFSKFCERYGNKYIYCYGTQSCREYFLKCFNGWRAEYTVDENGLIQLLPMTLKEQIKNRQQFNYEILETPIWAKIESYDRDFAEFIRKTVDVFNQGRFGQIICNALPDYRDEPSDLTRYVMETLFGSVKFDPFFEESYETLKRLK